VRRQRANPRPRAAVHGANALFRARYRDLRRRVAAHFAIERSEGRLAAAVEIDKLAPQVLAMLDGLQLQWLLDPGEVDMVELFRDFLERIGEE
jgi:hypothetical protein